MPGCAGRTGAARDGPAVPLFETAIITFAPTATSHGTWKLICSWPLTLSTANSATALLSTVNRSVRKVVGSGRPDVRLIPVVEVRLLPNAVAISPGTTPPPTKLAPFTTALTVATGG